MARRKGRTQELCKTYIQQGCPEGIFLVHTPRLKPFVQELIWALGGETKRLTLVSIQDAIARLQGLRLPVFIDHGVFENLHKKEGREVLDLLEYWRMRSIPIHTFPAEGGASD